MYSEEDINAAVASGAMTPEAAAALRSHTSQEREMPRVDEENFRLISSFNDIFVALAAVILLVAVGSIAGSIVSKIGEPKNYFALAAILFIPGTAVAATAWGLSEIFTRKRRMAFPSIVLLLAYVFAMIPALGSIIMLPFGLAMGPDLGDPAARTNYDPDETTAIVTVSIMMILIGVAVAAAAWVHWRRFMVPITVAAGTWALVTIITLTSTILNAGFGIGANENAFMALLFVMGIAVFVFAMRWDMSDRDRTTRRSDVAFWLHLLAAPLIAHPVFFFMGVLGGGDISVLNALGVLVVYVVFAFIAVAVDRRALLVSALIYVLFALNFLFNSFGAVELNFALTALVIGSALLMLSAYWSTIRNAVVSRLPEDIQDRLPVLQTLPT